MNKLNRMKSDSPLQLKKPQKLSNVGGFSPAELIDRII